MSDRLLLGGLWTRLVLLAVLGASLSYVRLSWAASSGEAGGGVAQAPPQLPYCPPKAAAQASAPPLLVVSTLDGALTALDPSLQGRRRWRLQTSPGSMLSSTISEMELTNQGKWVKLIPSLAGGLYKFDGETVEAVPLSAETLLRSSFKFADNTVITGGKESRTYGVEVASGRVRYECGLDGCNNMDSGLDGVNDDLLVVQRETQTVRALEPRTGVEKWNFSVSQHTLDLQLGDDDLCEDNVGVEDLSLDEQFKAVVSDGVICAVDRQAPDRVRWSHKFPTPIVHAWLVGGGQVSKVDLFSSSHLPERETPSSGDLADAPKPLLYIGAHRQQLYIQESDRVREDDGQAQEMSAAVHPYPKVSWRPYLISSSTRTPVYNHGGPDDDLPLLTYDEDVADNTALAVFHGHAYPFDSGLYLYPDEPNLEYDPLLDMVNRTAQDVVADDDLDEAPELIPGGRAIQVVIVSLWWWWKEVVLISFFTALMLNVMITRPIVQGIREHFRRRLEQVMRRRANVVFVEVPVPAPAEPQQQQQQPPATADSNSSLSTNGGFSWNNLAGDKEFVSRYVSDFEPVRCLGKGGFGVVFEAKNKIDDIHYAVKRIRLPKMEENRKKVMREVKFLAKLDHKNIVRYFNTWLETPPIGWQEKHDTWWRNADNMPTNSNFLSETGSELRGEASSLGREASTSFVDNDSNNKSPLSLTGDGEPSNDNSFSVVFEKNSGSGGSSGSSVDFEDNSGGSSIVFERNSGVSGGSSIVFEDSRNAEMEEEEEGSESDTSDDEGEGRDDEGSSGIVFATRSSDNENEDSSQAISWPNCDDNEDSSRAGAISFQSSQADTTTSLSGGGDSDCLDALAWDESNRRRAGDAAGQPAQLPPPPPPRPVYLYIVMQLCQEESLQEWLRRRTGDRDRSLALNLFRQICLGVEYVHGKGLIHRDMKPSNIFFSGEGAIKIGDFGLVTCTAPDADVDGAPPSLSPSASAERLGVGDGFQHTDQVGTELYMSPEQLARRPYNHKVDIYSLGLILFELLVPFSTQMERVRTLSDLRKLRFPENFEQSDEFLLVRAMLSHDHEARPETADILDTDFLKSAGDGAGPNGPNGPPSPAGGLTDKERRRRKTFSGSMNSMNKLSLDE